MAPASRWTRLSRRLGLDANPLRRRADLIAAWLLPGVLAALLVLGPLVAVGADHWAATRNAAAWQEQQSWHRVQAVLLAGAPGPQFPDGGLNSWTVWTPARWTCGGETHVASVPAVSDSPAGTTVTVWLDRAGNVRQPLTPAAAEGRAATAACLSLLALALLLSAAALVTRAVLDRRRVAGWGAAWLSVGPQWSGRR